MTLTLRLSIGFAMAGVLAYVATPYAIALANRLQFYDKPAGYKGHGSPTPYLGGAVVMAGFVIAMLVAAGDWSRTVPLVGGVILLWAVGTVDDRRTVSPLLRVLIELVLAFVIWISGLGWDLHVGGTVDLGLTCLWVLGVVNAFNLFDNMDGAASTMALVVSAGASLIGVIEGDAWLAVGAASLGGACLGFLPRNLCLPARIFLGDGGSMPLGFAAAVLVMVAARTSTVAWQSLLIGLLLVGIPALDTSLVIISRRRRGVSILTGGRDHLTHRARRFLPSARAVALSLGAIQAVVSLVAVLASRGGTSFVVISAVLYVLAAALAMVLLETQEVEEFGVAPQNVIPINGSRGRVSPGVVCLAVIGLGAGLSPFFFAYYDASIWVPIGLGLVIVCAIGVVARPTNLTGPAVLALGGFLGLGVWSLSSTAWAESTENAMVSGNRWLAYGALLLLALVLLRSDRRCALLLSAATLGVVAVALSVLVRLLGSNPEALFLGGRLNSPLGYINGEGCLFVMGFWLCMAASEVRRGLIAGPAAGIATLMASLALLSQSRGTALAMLGSLLVVMAFAPGRVRRAYGLLAIAAGVILAAPDLLHIYQHTHERIITLGTYHAAGNAALLGALAVGVAWGLLTALWEQIRSHQRPAARLRFTGAGLLVLLSGLALVVAAASSHRIQREAQTQWHAFTHLSSTGAAGKSAPSTSYSRLLSGSGNRYDYWRISLDVWQDHPVLGVGAGNYPRSYYEQRATTEDIEQPHSIELQTLSELGLVGALLLVGLLAGVGWAIWRTRVNAANSQLKRALMVGAVGAFAAWLTQTSVDWMHLLPGLTAIAIAAVATLLRTQSSQKHWSRNGLSQMLESRLVRVLGLSSILATLMVAGASLSREGLADIYRTRAQRELEAHPAVALTEANRSLDIDSDAVETYYVKAAALAHFDQARAAEAALTEALSYEPNNFVTWALFGDIAVRERRFALAKHDYARAHQLNPRNATLQELAIDPRS